MRHEGGIVLFERRGFVIDGEESPHWLHKAGGSFISVEDGRWVEFPKTSREGEDISTIETFLQVTDGDVERLIGRGE